MPISIGAFEIDPLGLGRYNTLTDQGTLPGTRRWVNNKSADQASIVNPENIDGTGHWEIFAYNNTGGALVAGNFYHLTADGDEETNPFVEAFTTAANTNSRWAVCAMKATAAAAWGWFAYSGWVDVVAVEGTTDVAKDDFLKFDVDTVSVVALIKDGSAVTNNSVAIASAAQTANSVVTIRCFLLGAAAVITQ
jgi:hypothetical protein